MSDDDNLARKARAATGLTQDAFAKLLRVTPGTVGRWESGKTAVEGLVEAVLTMIARFPDASVSMLNGKSPASKPDRRQPAAAAEAVKPVAGPRVAAAGPSKHLIPFDMGTSRPRTSPRMREPDESPAHVPAAEVRADGFNGPAPPSVTRASDDEELRQWGSPNPSGSEPSLG